MTRRFLATLLAALILAGCAGSKAPTAPVQAPKADEQSVPTAGQPAGGPALSQLQEEARAAAAELNASKEAAYARAWPRYVAATTALLAHPEAWSLGKNVPAELVLDQAAFRVYMVEGEYMYLKDEATRNTVWATTPVGKGQVLFQGSLGSFLTADALGDLLVLTFSAGQATLMAWQSTPAGLVPAEKALAEIRPGLGTIQVTRSANKLTLAGGAWRRFNSEGKPVYGQEGAPFFCPGNSAPLETCYQLTAEQGRLLFQAPDPAGLAALADPKTIRANLSIGYKDGGGGTPEAQAREAANRALTGLQAYLRKPLDQQLAPEAFDQLFQGSAPGSVILSVLAPNVRIYDVTTRPVYNPQGYALLQWWEDPTRPQVMNLEVGMFAGLWDAALFFGPEGERRLVYSAGTFPTQHRTGRTVTVLRYDAGQKTWVPDERAFSAKLPEQLGGVALGPRGATLSMYRPNDPPMSNPVSLDDKTQTLRICDTQTLCITLEYRNNVFTPKP